MATGSWSFRVVMTAAAGLVVTAHPAPSANVASNNQTVDDSRTETADTAGRGNQPANQMDGIDPDSSSRPQASPESGGRVDRQPTALPRTVAISDRNQSASGPENDASQLTAAPGKASQSAAASERTGQSRRTGDGVAPAGSRSAGRSKHGNSVAGNKGKEQNAVENRNHKTMASGRSNPGEDGEGVTSPNKDVVSSEGSVSGSDTADGGTATSKETGASPSSNSTGLREPAIAGSPNKMGAEKRGLQTSSKDAENNSSKTRDKPRSSGVIRVFHVVFNSRNSTNGFWRRVVSGPVPKNALAGKRKRTNNPRRRRYRYQGRTKIRLGK